MFPGVVHVGAIGQRRVAQGAPASAVLLDVPDQDAAPMIERVEALRADLVAAEATRRCVRPLAATSGGTLVGVVQPAEDGDCHDRARIVSRPP